jgi:hypothetical protein
LFGRHFGPWVEGVNAGNWHVIYGVMVVKFVEKNWITTGLFLILLQILCNFLM